MPCPFYRTIKKLEDITMSFTAADVKTLREMTSVGMMDCKKSDGIILH